MTEVFQLLYQAPVDYVSISLTGLGLAASLAQLHYARVQVRMAREETMEKMQLAIMRMMEESKDSWLARQPPEVKQRAPTAEPSSRIVAATARDLHRFLGILGKLSGTNTGVFSDREARGSALPSFEQMHSWLARVTPYIYAHRASRIKYLALALLIVWVLAKYVFKFV